MLHPRRAARAGAVGKGEVVDAAIVDGVSHLMTLFSGLIPSGRLLLARESNPLGGAAPFYRTDRCAEGREMAVGAIEPPFWAELLRLLAIPARGRGGNRDADVGAVGIVHPEPAPRFSRTTGSIRPASDGARLLATWVEGAESRGGGMRANTE